MKYYHCSRMHHKVGDIIHPHRNHHTEGIFVSLTKEPHWTLYDNGDKTSIHMTPHRLFRVIPLNRKTKIIKGNWDDIVILGPVEVVESLGQAPLSGKVSKIMNNQIIIEKYDVVKLKSQSEHNLDPSKKVNPFACWGTSDKHIKYHIRNLSNKIDELIGYEDIWVHKKTKEQIIALVKETIAYLNYSIKNKQEHIRFKIKFKKLKKTYIIYENKPKQEDTQEGIGLS